MKIPKEQYKSLDNRDKEKNIPYSKEEIINKAFLLHKKGNDLEAGKYYQLFINQGFLDFRVFLNYGTILQRSGDLKKAEFLQRKAIELNPNYAQAYYNLGGILIELGNLKEAEKHTRKAIELNPNNGLAFLNLGNLLTNFNNLKEAEKYTRKATELTPNSYEAHINLGILLSYSGKTKEAELSLRKGIELNTNFEKAHCFLGIILKNQGNFKEAELSLLKAIKLDPNYALAYYILSNLKFCNDTKWQDNLFSENILINQSKDNKVNIFFARSNILHNQKKYKESAKYLEIANNYKLELNKSKYDRIIKKTRELLTKSNIKKIDHNNKKNSLESIFIVGMPRSGSTLVESILSVKKSVQDLGEINIFEEAFIKWNKYQQKLSLDELYFQEISNKFNKLGITTNKWLYNYQYAGIISHHIPNAKIIHCYRNPFDNILSIYRAHFAEGNSYASSIVDTAKVYLDQVEIMDNYKNKYRTKIYDLNYDLLVKNPKREIKSLISWLGWEWIDSYLSPNLNTRTVLTASNVQVRYPINSKSLSGWKNYKDMLRPAMEIITQNVKYRNLIY